MKNTDMTELDMFQLDTVNGGTIGQVTCDSELLHKLGLMDEEFLTAEVMFDWISCSDKVDKAWAKIGITCDSYYNYNNYYYYQGKGISWNEAQKIAKDKMIQGPKIGPLHA